MAVYFSGVLIGYGVGEEDGAAVGALIGWFLGAGWAIFAAIQLILQIVHLIQIL